MVSILSMIIQYLSKKRLFFRKIKLNRKLDRKSLKLTTHNNERFVTNTIAQ